MAIWRRRQLALSWLLAVLLGGGAVLPSSALWQCRHAARVVGGGFVAAPSAMPCRMGGPIPKMACCPLPERLAAKRHTGFVGQTLSPPACRPTLTRLATLPTATAPETHVRLRQSLALRQAALPPPATPASPASLTLALRQRPPPTVGLFPPSAPEHTPGLRAPPAA